MDSRFIKIKRTGKVTNATYYNTMIGLAKTRDKQIKHKIKEMEKYKMQEL